MFKPCVDIKQDEKTRFSIPVIKELLGQLSWFKQANMALALVKDAASKFMAGHQWWKRESLSLTTQDGALFFERRLTRP